MTAEGIEKRRAYYREYYRTHKDRIQKNKERYWDQKAKQEAISTEANEQPKAE